MFCDLVGSTSISAQLDAEEWRDLVEAYLDAATAAVKEMGGHVAKKLGDGLMALFGYPLAQENDAERTERTGGVPLFIEEVTRLLLERGEQGGVQAIPPTLQQSLMARLDRLGPAREVAQIGAVIGRYFSYPLIRAVTEMENSALEAALERLAEADILLVQALIQDAGL